MRIPATPLFPARTSLPRLLVHALVAWALGAVLLVVLVSVFERTVASALFTFGAPALTALVAALYFRRGQAEEPLIAALAFTAVAAALDVLVALGARGQVELLDPAFGFGPSLLLVFGTTGFTGELVQPRSGRAA